MTKIYTVNEIASLLKGTLETRFPFIWVRGQVSNLARPSSGHVYFTLKDEQAAIDAIWFKGNQRPAQDFDPLTGEIFSEGARPNLALTMQVGEEVLCAGQISMYTPQGRLQLVVEFAEPAGLGLLQQEFERLKQKLFELGYFDLARKRNLPPGPTKVAVITAPTGAAVHDFLRIAQNRGLGGEIRIYPSLVQGESAPGELAAALKHANQHAWAEVIVLIRGGGSLEDLWAFNTEEVAAAIFNSKLPVLTGIGHEPDISLADLTADLRAATPSHAAQLLWVERNTLVQQTDELELDLIAALRRNLQKKESGLLELGRYLTRFSPQQTLLRMQDRLRQTWQELHFAWQKISFKHEKQMQQIERLKLLAEANLERKAAKLPEATLFASLLNQALIRYENKLPSENLLRSLLKHNLDAQESALSLLCAKLEAGNPMLPLARGYALLATPDGQALRRVEDVSAGVDVDILLANGKLEATVNKVSKNS